MFQIYAPTIVSFCSIEFKVIHSLIIFGHRREWITGKAYRNFDSSDNEGKKISTFSYPTFLHCLSSINNASKYHANHLDVRHSFYLRNVRRLTRSIPSLRFFSQHVDHPNPRRRWLGCGGAEGHPFFHWHPRLPPPRRAWAPWPAGSRKQCNASKHLFYRPQWQYLCCTQGQS